jgi:hypothetical protein
VNVTGLPFFRPALGRMAEAAITCGSKESNAEICKCSFGKHYCLTQFPVLMNEVRRYVLADATGPIALLSRS